MKRVEAIVVVFAAIALLWGYGASALAGAAGWNPIAGAACALVPVAVFGWLRRGRELIDVAAPSFGVAYAAYIGLAIARVAQLDDVSLRFGIDLLDNRWPPVLMAGIAFALIATVCIAVPASALQRWRHVENERDTRFWAIVSEQNAARSASKPRPS